MRELFKLWRRTVTALDWQIKFLRVRNAILLIIIVNPATKCKLRYVQLQRVYDYLQIENEYIKNRIEAKKNEVANEVSCCSFVWEAEWRNHNRVYPRVSSHYLYCGRDHRRWQCDHQHQRNFGISCWRGFFCRPRSLRAWSVCFCYQYSMNTPFLRCSQCLSLESCRKTQTVRWT